MTASSSYSGTVDNFWSRDDIRVHTFAGTPKAVEVLAEGSFEGKPNRTAGAKRRGAEAARQPVSASDLLGATRALAARRHGADPDAKTRTSWNATSACSLTPSCANCVSVYTGRQGGGCVIPHLSATRPRDGRGSPGVRAPSRLRGPRFAGAPCPPPGGHLAWLLRPPCPTDEDDTEDRRGQGRAGAEEEDWNPPVSTSP